MYIITILTIAVPAITRVDNGDFNNFEMETFTSSDCYQICTNDKPSHCYRKCVNTKYPNFPFKS